MNKTNYYLQKVRLDAVPNVANRMRLALSMLPPAPVVNHTKQQAVLSPLSSVTLGDLLMGWKSLWDMGTDVDGNWKQIDTPAGELWNGPALNLVKDSVVFARAEAAKLSPILRAEIANYNAGRTVSPFFVGFFAKLNAYFEQGQARPGKLTATLAQSASNQWTKDAERSGVWNTLDSIATIGAAAVFIYTAYLIATAPTAAPVAAPTAAPAAAPTAAPATVAPAAAPAATIPAAAPTVAPELAGAAAVPAVAKPSPAPTPSAPVQTTSTAAPINNDVLKTGVDMATVTAQPTGMDAVFASIGDAATQAIAATGTAAANQILGKNNGDPVQQQAAQSRAQNTNTGMMVVGGIAALLLIAFLASRAS